ncbi:hypothetical protein EI94DRAFT_1738243 [Lactarius quietus]|nr:hypothetical protein EI94DRAFT_1738243 [Lactarius quietus]
MNNRDLQTMAVPDKYKQDHVRHELNLPRYYKGQATVPVLTIVIGGDHEASNHNWERWLAPNVYFLDHAGCVQVNGIRIAGASGIFKPNDYHRGHFEKQPYENSTMRNNPDEIAIGDENDDFDVPGRTAAPQNQDEIGLENEGEAVMLPPPARRETKFLALDKCLSRPCRHPSKEDGASTEEPATVVLSYDPEWPAITRAFQPYLSREREPAVYPDPDSARAAVARGWDWAHALALPKLGVECRVDAGQRFVQGFDGAHQQTNAFLALLEMENVVR